MNHQIRQNSKIPPIPLTIKHPIVYFPSIHHGLLVVGPEDLRCPASSRLTWDPPKEKPSLSALLTSIFAGNFGQKNMFLYHLKNGVFFITQTLAVRSMTWDLQTLLPYVACFLSGVPGDSGILGANTMVATVFQALGPYSPLLCQHPSLSFDKKMEDMKAPPGWDGWSWAWDGMEPGNTW